MKKIKWTHGSQLWEGAYEEMHKESILVKKLIEFSMRYIVQYQENGTGWNSTSI